MKYAPAGANARPKEPRRSRNPAELAEAAEDLGRVEPPPPHRAGDLAHVKVALRIHAHTVGGDELGGSVPEHRVAESLEAFGSEAETGEAWREERRLRWVYGTPDQARAQVERFQLLCPRQLPETDRQIIARRDEAFPARQADRTHRRCHLHDRAIGHHHLDVQIVAIR